MSIEIKNNYAYPVNIVQSIDKDNPDCRVSEVPDPHIIEPDAVVHVLNIEQGVKFEFEFVETDKPQNPEDERRLRRYIVTEKELFELSDVNALEPYVLSKFPGAEIQQSYMSPEDFQVTVQIEHDKFDYVPLGKWIPTITEQEFQELTGSEPEDDSRRLVHWSYFSKDEGIGNEEKEKMEKLLGDGIIIKQMRPFPGSLSGDVGVTLWCKKFPSVPKGIDVPVVNTFELYDLLGNSERSENA